MKNINEIEFSLENQNNYEILSFKDNNFSKLEIINKYKTDNFVALFANESCSFNISKNSNLYNYFNYIYNENSRINNKKNQEVIITDKFMKQKSNLKIIKINNMYKIEYEKDENDTYFGITFFNDDARIIDEAEKYLKKGKQKKYRM